MLLTLQYDFFPVKISPTLRVPSLTTREQDLPRSCLTSKATQVAGFSGENSIL